MKRAQRRSMMTVIAFLGGVLAVGAQDQAPASAPYAGATVSEWTGKVQVQPPGGLLSAPTRRQVLPPGTVLDTGDGRLLLRLEDESEILLRPHTRLLLKQPGPGNWNYLELMLGRIRARVMRRTGGEAPFQLGTPSAVIAVRGTRFDVEVNPRRVTEVDVFEGLVEVGGVGVPGSSVLVRPGYSTRVGPGGAPEPPVATGEIRPGFEVSQENLGAELTEEKEIDQARAEENEISERGESRVEELSEEAAEGREGPQEDKDEPQPPKPH